MSFDPSLAYTLPLNAEQFRAFRQKHLDLEAANKECKRLEEILRSDPTYIVYTNPTKAQGVPPTDEELQELSRKIREITQKTQEAHRLESLLYPPHEQHGAEYWKWYQQLKCWM